MPLQTEAILQSTGPLMTPEIQRAKQRDQDIVLLKAIRQATLDLRVQCDQYDRSLSGEFLEALRKVERVLSALLLERELYQQPAVDETYEAAYADIGCGDPTHMVPR